MSYRCLLAAAVAVASFACVASVSTDALARPIHRHHYPVARGVAVGAAVGTAVVVGAAVAASPVVVRPHCVRRRTSTATSIPTATD